MCFIKYHAITTHATVQVQQGGSCKGGGVGGAAAPGGSLRRRKMGILNEKIFDFMRSTSFQLLTQIKRNSINDRDFFKNS